jgi:tetratricopeptide (TPR) repeat protein
MSSPLTVGERILLHLARFSKHQESYDVPFDVSQDGVASSLRISRAHAAIELKKLKESEMVSERLAHIRGGKSRRKVYFLTVTGEERAYKIREYAERQGIDIAPLLDLRRCDAEELWDSLSQEMRWVLGRACVFRRAFRREALPGTSVALLPEDNQGMVEMPQKLRDSIPTLVPEGELKSHHSFAADYWLENDDYRERLFHLLKAGRRKEAEILLAQREHVFSENPDRELMELVFEFDGVSDRYRNRINRLKAEMALALEDESRCLMVLEEMRTGGQLSERLEAIRIEGRMLLQNYRAEEAYRILLQGRSMLEERINIPLECDITRALISMGKYEEAEITLGSLLPLCVEQNDGQLIGHIYYLLGIMNLKKGDYQDSIRYLSKSIGMSKEEERPNWYVALSEAYTGLGMKEQAEHWRAKLPKFKGWNSDEAYQYRLYTGPLDHLGSI